MRRSVKTYPVSDQPPPAKTKLRQPFSPHKKENRQGNSGETAAPYSEKPDEPRASIKPHNCTLNKARTVIHLPIVFYSLLRDCEPFWAGRGVLGVNGCWVVIIRESIEGSRGLEPQHGGSGALAFRAGSGTRRCS